VAVRRGGGGGQKGQEGEDGKEVAGDAAATAARRRQEAGVELARRGPTATGEMTPKKAEEARTGVAEGRQEAAS
jgi:hypothetical protein